MDWAKSGEAMRLFKDVLPARASYPRKFDIMLVDEAHNVAPAGAGRYALESQRTAMIKLHASFPAQAFSHGDTSQRLSRVIYLAAIALR